MERTPGLNETSTLQDLQEQIDALNEALQNSFTNSAAIMFTISGQPSDAQIFPAAIDRDLTLPDGATFSVALALTAPADGDAVFTVKKNGSSIGTITIPQDTLVGVFAMAETTFANGDSIEVHCPEVANSAMKDIAITFHVLRGTEPTNETGMVETVFARTGNVVGVLGDYDTDIVENTSDVPGATLTDALNALATLLP